jgi:hypothetical protein
VVNRPEIILEADSINDIAVFNPPRNAIIRKTLIRDRPLGYGAVSHSLSAGAIAGIVIGVVVILVLIGVLVWYFGFHRRARAALASMSVSLA